MLLVTISAVQEESAYVALALISFVLFAIQIKGSVFFILSTDLFSAAKVAMVRGVSGGFGSLGGNAPGVVTA